MADPSRAPSTPPYESSDGTPLRAFELLTQDMHNATESVVPEMLMAQRLLQRVVRHYFSQILWGCSNANCTTPTCLSCNKRFLTRPFRPPTELTARAMAHFLASQDDPQRGLCPSPLKISLDKLEIEGSMGWTIGNPYRHSSDVSPLRLPVTTWAAADLRRIFPLLCTRRQAKKDPKSLVQNMFDTFAIIHYFSMQIRNPLSSTANTAARPLAIKSDVKTDGERNSSPVVEEIRSRGPDAVPIQYSNPNLRHENGTSGPTLSNEAPMLRQAGHAQQRRSEGLESPSPLCQSEASASSEHVHGVQRSLLGTDHDRALDSKDQASASFDGVGENPTSPKKEPSPRDHVPHGFGSNHTVSHPRLPVPQAHLRQGDEDQQPVPTTALVLDCESLESFKKLVSHYGGGSLTENRKAADLRYNSISLALSRPESLLLSFREADNKEFENSPLCHLNSANLTHAFRGFGFYNGPLVFSRLSIAVDALFTPPPWLDITNSPHSKTLHVPSLSKDRASESSSGQRSARPAPATRYLSDEEAAHIVMICIHALTSAVSVGSKLLWADLRVTRHHGEILPSMKYFNSTLPYEPGTLDIIDDLEYEPALSLADRLVRGIGARLCFARILETVSPGDTCPKGLMDIVIQHLAEVERIAKVATEADPRYHDLDRDNSPFDDPGWTVTATFLEWLRTIILKKWDGKAVVNSWGNVGAAVSILDMFYTNRDTLDLHPHMFNIKWLYDHIDSTVESTEFIKRANNPNFFHLFEYPCLFERFALNKYFRTINYASMHRKFEDAQRTQRLLGRLGEINALQEKHLEWLKNRLHVSLHDYLVIEVSREHMLEETLNQLWAVPKFHLLKPLKVNMGLDHAGGELGQDQGGVTSEFFRLVLTEAFQPNNGMFTVDAQTQMTWFRPATLEPDWKFEMLGLLFSLAVYNGVTLPVTFPIALYWNLLAPHRRNPIKRQFYPGDPDFIRDGWPMLAKSFEELLSWSEGDVADIFMREYSFSFDAFSQNIDVDMRAFDTLPSQERLWPADHENAVERPQHGYFSGVWPSDVSRPGFDSPGWRRPMPEYGGSTQSAPEEIPLVTNANRQQFVSDYIFWLTYRSVASQMEAFRRGFCACLEPRSLLLFEPLTLQALVEGTQEIDLEELNGVAWYEDGYSSTDEIIKDFWSIVYEYDIEKRKKLLAFVTGSERVPATGMHSVVFVIARSEADTDRLPTSSTCFGKLFLPEYASREKLETKLDLAIENATGFGLT